MKITKSKLVAMLKAKQVQIRKNNEATDKAQHADSIRYAKERVTHCERGLAEAKRTLARRLKEIPTPSPEGVRMYEVNRALAILDIVEGDEINVSQIPGLKSILNLL